MDEHERHQKEIEMLRRRELDPNRIGDQFLEKLRKRNQILAREEQERLDREAEEQKLLSHPNRYTIERALKTLRKPIVIILRGLIGSGKSRAAKCIKEETTELDDEIMCRILSLDDYFMDAVEMEVMEDGKEVIRKKIVYQYDGEREEEYRELLYKKLDKTLQKGDHEVIVVDACNNKQRDLDAITDSCEHHRASTIICEMEEWNEACCFHRGSHNRTLQDIHRMKRDWFDTPSDMNALDWSFKTTKAVQMKLTQQDLEQKPMDPALKRVLDKVEDNNKRLKSSHQKKDGRLAGRAAFAMMRRPCD